MKLHVSAFALLMAATPALANSDLVTSISSDQGVDVYDVTGYDVTVSNIGNKTANSAAVDIHLPATATSPVVHVMGDLGAISGGCSLSGTTLHCNLGALKRGKSATVSFDITYPEVAGPLTVTAHASTSSAENSTTNNDDSDVADQVFFDTVIAGPRAATNDHCTGTNLTSFYECSLYPSSITSHDTVFEANHTVSFPGFGVYTGTWSQPTPDSLIFQYTYMGAVQADFEGFGVGGDCFEGLTTFPGSAYVSPYRVCLQ